MNTSTTTPLVGTLEYRVSTPVGRRRPVKSRAAAANAVQIDAVQITVAPQQTISYSDVLANLGITSASSGELVLTTTSGSAAVTALMNDTVDGVGTFSTSLPVGPDTITKGDSREFGGIQDAAPARIAAKDSNSFSTAFGMAETSGKSAVVQVTVYYSAISGSLTGQQSVALPPRTYALTANGVTPLLDLRNEFFASHRDDFGDLNIRVDFQVIDGDGAVMPYVVSTESATGDRLVRSGRF